ncbi:MAG: bifunctional folylpolyglutamate synthase/dihydrofolate synthase [Streptococcaceae bacterium]|jgi:dihydrofolate synthase/folylpolyglutamate synthase|nr:bifunctional folylpolyglutamate synthase/dihydrofolate synthase [Streptococcaceae bacterium]
MTESINWLHGRLKFGSRPGLDRVLYLLNQLDNPQEKIKSVHIAGTNGKGSTLTFLRNSLEMSNLKVGTFTSPFIEVFNERIQINGKFITNEAIDELVAVVKPLVLAMDKIDELSGVTEFEIITAIAFYYFALEAVDIALIEVGLGGLLDSTNVISPLLSVITTIGLDHQDILGNQIEAIARQKAGIIKANTPVVLGNIPDTALKVIDEIAEDKGSSTVKLFHDFDFEQLAARKISYHGLSNTGEFELGLAGNYQSENAAVALACFEVLQPLLDLSFELAVLKQAIKQAFWPARMEKINGFILDGAHNLHAINRLVEEFRTEKRPVHILFSALATKDYQEMLALLKEIPQVDLSVTTFDYPSALDLNQLKAIPDVKVYSDWREYLAQQKAADEIYLITGSLYFLAQVRQSLLKNSDL